MYEFKFHYLKDSMANNDPSCSKIQGLPEEVRNVICNAQVITTLAGAGRELIDNSIDAGATNIEIRLTENGVDILEVIDNGKGIAEENFEYLAKKHCTSKIREMKDLDEIETFGFRGEALNALATFSKVIITTKTQTAPIATRLTYNLSNIEKKEKTAGKVGTSVAIHDLFRTLPVRRHELSKNSKKEFVKLVNTIQAFAFARPDIKFTCSNMIKGKKIPVLSTPGGKATLRDTISTIFGCRAEKDNLLEIVDTIPDAKIRTQCNITTAGERQFEVLQIHGYISSTESGLGSHARDRQFIFVNKRHVDYPEASKVINDMYRQQNKNRYAIYVLFVTVHPTRVNVNITPDKRTIKLRDEPIFFGKLRASLQKAFIIDKGTYTPINPKTEPATQVPVSPKLPPTWTIKQSLSQIEKEQEQQNQQMDGVTVASKQQPRNNDARNERMPPTGFASTLPPNPTNILPKPSKRLPTTPSNVLQKSDSAKKRKTTSAGADTSHNSSAGGNRSGGSHLFKSLWTTPLPNDNEEMEIIDSSSSSIDQRELVHRMHNASQEMDDSVYDDGNEISILESSSRDNVFVDKNGERISKKKKDASKMRREVDADQMVTVAEDLEEGINDENEISIVTEKMPKRDPVKQLLENPPEWYYGYLRKEMPDSEEAFATIRICHQEQRSPAEIGHEKFLEVIKSFVDADVAAASSLSQLQDLSFEDAEDEKIANEEDTKVVIQKEDFSRMKVLWQFNKSFIFCNLDKHVFIVDQHAADEKANFENYVKNAKLKRQMLIKPITLHLSPVQEQVLRNNQDVFLRNGFDFAFNELNLQNRVQMTFVPNFIGIQCGIDEVEEILSYLSESDINDSNYRPEKVLKGFASKACRRSVMVGDQLEMKQMQTLVSRLAFLDKPWNCPHGRPTVRLLKINLPSPSLSQEKQVLEELAQQFQSFGK